MNRDLELSLIDQALNQLDNQSRHMIERSGSAPVSHYVDAVRYKQEIDVLFRQFPIGVAHTNEIAVVGDYVVRQVAGLSMIVLRGKDGIARAFLNACRHRGALLLDNEKGNSAHISCPYHAWTYDDKGALMGMPGPEGFCDLDKKSLGLNAFPCLERYGVIWVVPSLGCQVDWERWFAPVHQELTDLNIEKYVVFYERNIEIAANWKAVSDAFMEGYHFRFVHKNSVAPMYFDNQGIFTPLWPHYRYLLMHRSMQTLSQKPRDSWQLRQHCLMVYQLFPATSIQVLPDHIFLHTLIPNGQGKTIARNVMLIPEQATTDKAKNHWRINQKMVCDALDEDHAIAERVFSGISAGINSDLIFGRYEQGITHMHEIIASALQGELSVIHKGE